MRKRWYPTRSHVLLVVDELRRGTTEAPERANTLAGLLRDEALLDSALALPQQPYYRTTILEAAALLRSMVKNYPFADGNKRVRSLVAALFLEQNGYALVASQDELADVVLALAASDPPMSVAEIARWLREHTRRIEVRT